MGPNWIHGTQNNPILDLVRLTRTPTHDWGERQAAFAPNGKSIPDDEAAENSQMLWTVIGEAFKHSEAHSVDIDPEISLMDYIKENVDARFWKHSKSTGEGDAYAVSPSIHFIGLQFVGRDEVEPS
jgi:hypothetical protein